MEKSQLSLVLFLSVFWLIYWLYHEKSDSTKEFFFTLIFPKGIGPLNQENCQNMTNPCSVKDVA